MRRRFLILVLCALPVAIASQGANTVRVGRGAIAGRVVSDETAPQPIRRVAVALKGGEGADRSTTTTDDGRFSFRDLPAGRYTLTARKAAYIETAYGATKPGGTGSAIAITSEEHVELTLRLTRGGVLAGTITNLAQEPLSEVLINALSVRTSGDLKGIGDTVKTDDRGMYRIFGLPPGDYVLRATMPTLDDGHRVEQPAPAEIDATLRALAERSSGGAPGTITQRASAAISAPSSGGVFAPVYFPGVPWSQEATRVTLRASEERAGLDFWFDAVRTTKIDGVVSGPVRDLTAVQVNLQFIGQSASRTARPNADGTFVLSDVPPGRYRIVARANPSQTAPTPPPEPRTFSMAAAEAQKTAGADFLYADAEVETRGVDVTGVSLILQPGGTLSGRIRFDATRLTAPRQLPPIRVSLAPIGGSGPPVVVAGSGFTMLREASLRADGTFAIAGIGPGAYRFQAALPADMSRNGWWLRSAIVDGRDLLDVETAFTPGLDLNNVAVTVSDRHTQLSGVLQTSSGQSASDYVIVVFSTDPQSWRALARRTQAARPDSAGRFEVRDLPPGEYFMAAVAEISSDDLTTGTFFEQLAPAAIRVVLGEGEQRIQNLQLEP
jgi:hypothetical protein